MTIATPVRRIGHGALGAAVLLVYLAQVWRFRAYINDDAYITFRHSLFLALGRGPYYNLGEHVEGYTNFLLMLLLTPFTRLVGEPAAVVAKLIGIAGGLLALLSARWLCAHWLRRIERLAPHADWLAWLAPALVAANAAYALNSVSGLETTLYSGLVTLALALLAATQASGRWRGAGVALGLALLTRPEGAFVAGLALTAVALSYVRPRQPLPRALRIDASIVALTLVAQLVFRWLYYDGDLLPNTYYAKSGDLLLHLDAGPYIWQYTLQYCGGPAAFVALLPLAARQPAVRRATLPALLVCVLLTASTYKTGTDWMLGYRPLVPYAPLWAALAVCGLAVCATRARRVTPWAAGLTLALLALVVGLQWQPRRQLVEQVDAGVQGYRTGHLAAAWWLHGQARTGQVVALMDIGLIGYVNPDLRILDITGLTDRHIARSSGGFLEKHYDPAYVLDQQPDYIILVVTRRESPAGVVDFLPKTRIESRLFQHPEFRAHYWRPPPGDHPLELNVQSDTAAHMATCLGATRVFVHSRTTPYLLAVYARH